MPARGRALPLIELDSRLATPVYLQVFRQIERYATAGRLRGGDQLPTVRQLAAQLRVNFNTVARAYRLLHRAGVVSAQQGRGTFVQPHPSAPRANNITLHALTASYIAEARRHSFAATEVEHAVRQQLRRLGRGTHAGDSHG